MLISLKKCTNSDGFPFRTHTAHEVNKRDQRTWDRRTLYMYCYYTFCFEGFGSGTGKKMSRFYPEALWGYSLPSWRGNAIVKC
jgi:hypothetical protein